MNRSALSHAHWIAVVLFATTSLFAGPTYVFVSLDGDREILTFELQEDGRLDSRARYPLDIAPGALVSDPRGRFLFASLRTGARLASFRVDPQTGELAGLGSVPAAEDPAFVATDASGRFLFSAYYVAAKISRHRIREDGSIDPEKPLWISTATKAHAILQDPSTSHFLVPHTGPNRIFSFRFDVRTGSLKANQPASVFTGKNTGPRQLFFHPSGRYVYFDNEQGSSVTAYHFDASKGTIRPFQTLPTLPKEFRERNSCARLLGTPNGRFLYAANRGHDSLACYEVDAETGALRSLGNQATEATPRGFGIDARGRFLVAAGQ
ncbi:MAG: beta-propeller fold lactonase family protein, partial [Planctomycetota bacterium]